jgi:hypothetical protein
MTTTFEQTYTNETYPQTQDLTADDYVVIGLATCFMKVEGEVQQLSILEPIPSAALEAIYKNVPTSYEWAIATTLGSIIGPDGPIAPQGLPEGAQIAKDFAYRSTAAARTYKRAPHAQALLALGDRKSDLNYSLDRKRILNGQKALVKASDNVKQHAHTHKVL